MKQVLDIHHDGIKALLDEGAPVYLSVNPIEYHGPHLPLRTDAIISRGLALELHARLARRHPHWPMIVAQDLNVGVDPTPGPGSCPASYRLVKRMVLDACRGLAQLGARRVILMTFHGHPLHNSALHEGVLWLESQGIKAISPMNRLLRELLDPDLDRFEPALANLPETVRPTILSELRTDFHAGFVETSLVLHYKPDAVAPDRSRLPPCPSLKPPRLIAALASMASAFGAEALARELHFVGIGTGWTALRPFPGYTGQPRWASVEAGAALSKLIADEYAEIAESVFEGDAESPRPIMGWLPWVTLGGLLPAPGVDLKDIGVALDP